MLKIPFLLRSAESPIPRLVLIFTALYISSFSSPGFTQGHPPWVADELLVGFRAGVSRGDAENVYRRQGANLIEELPRINVHRIRVAPAALEGVEQAISRHPNVEFVERNRRRDPVYIPNDPIYSSQWHLPKISADLAWEVTQGSSSVVVAILDSGVDPTHPDLSAKLVGGYNFYDNNTNTADVRGHGTKVAGSAAAICDNGVGVASPACQSLIMPIRVSGAEGYTFDSILANGLTWAADHGAKVMNMSFSGVAGSSTIMKAAQYAVRKGSVVIGAAGNCGCFDSTSDNPYIISVSATDASDGLASWSSRGNYVDVAAPGLGIYTTASGGGYSAPSGTSFSSPVTVGVVALMMAANPALTPSEIESLLEANADDLGPGGYDTSYGYGRINAYRAVLAAIGSVPQPDQTPPTAGVVSPAQGAGVSGSTVVSVSADDNVGVDHVDLFIDGSFYASDATAPYSFSWDTTLVNDGSHTLLAKAYDAAGNVGTSATISVTVANGSVGGDNVPPTVSINSLASSGGNGKGRGNASKVTVDVSASDNVAVTQVEVYVDGALAGSTTTAPYTFNINTRPLSSGTHTIEAAAYDPSGNVGHSNPVGYTK